MTIRAGVDVGGTFTDVIVLDESSGRLASAKRPTNYENPLAPILEGLALLAGEDRVTALNHATTLSTNAILERRLPRGALLTTMGFRDVLDIGRIQRPEEGIYDFNVDNPQPLIDRELRLEVTERLSSDGAVVTPLDEDALRQTLRDVAARGDVHSVAVCGLFSFVNDVHEKRIGEIAREELGDTWISLSSEVAPEIREFERTSTVVLDALLKPIVAPYLTRLDTTLADNGIDTTRIMMASGGLTSCADAARMPVNTINSGPSAGVLASANLGRQLALEELITIDMGGTSLDIGVIENGQAVQKYDGQIAGYPVRMPAIDVAAVAAGGGSLALVDELGYVQVDRESAGSTPGPACYGRGGARPTITDADVLLGRLGTDLGGRGGFTLDASRAKAAVSAEISSRLGVDADTAATSVLDIIQARMFKAIASNTLEKGLDIRALPLLAYGGAGPTHGVELAHAMGIRRVLVPYFAGNFSAIGLLLCPMRWDRSEMVLRDFADVTPSSLATRINALDADARKSAGDASLTTTWLAHMRYAGQSYDLAVGIDEPWTGSLDRVQLERLRDNFHALHERRYAYRSETENIELVQLRVTAAGREIDFPKAESPTAPVVSTGQRRVYFTTDRAWHTATIWQRADLPEGTQISGPAVVEGEGSSTLVAPDWIARTDAMRNLDIQRESQTGCSPQTGQYSA